ncbi:hypothetical protein B0H14DRAFT_2737148 [Mycena olivaceomarginata]|nr:hypothetical protein B0H14DRAFT_2737148 [Mycena olivaceomarginata]
MAYTEFAGVLCLALVALLSLLAVSFYFMKPSLRGHTYGSTHINGYFRSLLVANAVQAFGTVMNFKWAAERGVTSGSFCSAQGGIKQAGNIATALWFFVLAVHLFNLLFLRQKSTEAGFWCTIVGGWSLVIFVVVIGPTAVETTAKGPYFGISGAWCWITSNYPQEQIFLEYFFEYLSAVFCCVIYTTIFLRMRGNLVAPDKRWRLRFLPSGEAWKLARRDRIDTSMVQAVRQMMWFPIVYILLIVPITIVRRSEYGGAKVPFWVTILTDCIFNLTGLVNVVLLVETRRRMPLIVTQLPQYTRPRQTIRQTLMKACSIEPFTIERSETAEKFYIEGLARSAANSRQGSRRSSLEVTVPAQVHVNRTP